MKIIKSKTIDTIVNNKLINRMETYYNEQELEICRISSDGFRLDRRYNEQGKEIYYKDTTGLEYVKYYNELGQETKCQYTNRSGYVKEYNEQGLETVYLHTCGAYERKKYDEQGRIILKQDHLGNEYVYNYEIIGKPEQMYSCTMINNNSGYTEYFVYDDNNRLRINVKNNTVQYEYDDKNRIILELKKGVKRYWKYDNDKITCFTKNHGDKIEIDYVSYLDERGREVKTEFTNGKISESKYDEYDNCVYTKIIFPNGEIGIVICNIEYY